MGQANNNVAQPMAKRLACSLALLLLTSCSQASPLAPGVKSVEEIRGKKFVRSVRNVTIDRSDLSKHLLEQMVRTTPYPLEDWGNVLQALQLVDVKAPELVPKLLALYEAQVLAFYDPWSHTYYSIRQLPELPAEAARMADPEMLAETVMVHELTHALQDQLFSLSETEKQLMTDTDANLAYHAVLEGEAVLVMVAHMLKKAGVELDEAVKDDGMRGLITTAAQADSMIDPSTPRYFAETLKFPYLHGLDFVLGAYRRGGWAAVDQLHSRPPRSTRELLHPEEYFARTTAIAPVEVKKPEGAIAAEHLGEFHWRFLVGAERARGLSADRAVVFRDGRVEVETKWDSAAQAEAFAVAYRAFLEKRGLAPVIAHEGLEVRAAYEWK